MPNNIDMGGFATVGGPPITRRAPGGAANGPYFCLTDFPIGRNVNISFGVQANGTNVSAPNITAQVPDGRVSGGNTRGGFYAGGNVDWQMVRNAATQVADQFSICSVIAGGQNNTASGTAAVVSGGSGNGAGNYCVIGGGVANVAGAAGDHATVGGGSSNGALNHRAVVAGGQSNSADGVYTWIPGGASAKTRDITGAYAWSSGARTTAGDCQQIGQPVRATTTDATTTTLSAGGAAVGATTVMVLPNNSSLSGIVVVTARDTAGNCATWWIAYRVTRGANAASTTVAYQTTLASSLDAALSTATAVVAANTTLGALIISVAGVAATTIDWAADPFGPLIVR